MKVATRSDRGHAWFGMDNGGRVKSRRPTQARRRLTLSLHQLRRQTNRLPDGDKLDIIVNQVQAYESRHHPIEASWPMQG